jgi:hypothetical protein
MSHVGRIGVVELLTTSFFDPKIYCATSRAAALMCDWAQPGPLTASFFLVDSVSEWLPFRSYPKEVREKADSGGGGQERGWAVCHRLTGRWTNGGGDGGPSIELGF